MSLKLSIQNHIRNREKGKQHFYTTILQSDSSHVGFYFIKVYQPCESKKETVNTSVVQLRYIIIPFRFL